jgi:hypothetical protein
MPTTCSYESHDRGEDGLYASVPQIDITYVSFGFVLFACANGGLQISVMTPERGSSFYKCCYH